MKNMNLKMIWGTFRHFLTLLSGIILAGQTVSIETAIPDLIKKITEGDISTIVSSGLVAFSLLWSIWDKATQETKTTVIKKLTLGKINV